MEIALQRHTLYTPQARATPIMPKMLRYHFSRYSTVPWASMLRGAHGLVRRHKGIWSRGLPLSYHLSKPSAATWPFKFYTNTPTRSQIDLGQPTHETHSHLLKPGESRLCSPSLPIHAKSVIQQSHQASPPMNIGHGEPDSHGSCQKVLLP